MYTRSYSEACHESSVTQCLTCPVSRVTSSFIFWERKNHFAVTLLHHQWGSDSADFGASASSTLTLCKVWCVISHSSLFQVSACQAKTGRFIFNNLSIQNYNQTVCRFKFDYLKSAPLYIHTHRLFCPKELKLKLTLWLLSSSKCSHVVWIYGYIFDFEGMERMHLADVML